MRPRLRVSIRAMLLVVLACSLAAWVARGFLYPNRLAGRRFALIGPFDLDRDGKDDREAVKALLLGQGGAIDFDLPLVSPSSGKIGPGTTHWLANTRGSRVVGDSRYEVEREQALRDLRRNGVEQTGLMTLRREISGTPSHGRSGDIEWDD